VVAFGDMINVVVCFEFVVELGIVFVGDGMV